MSGKEVGGYARAKKLSPKERSDIASKAANVRWGNEPVFDTSAYLKTLEAERKATLNELKALRGTLRLLNRSIAQLQHRIESRPKMQVVAKLPSLYTQEDCKPVDKNSAS
jgi:hypothetical protein